MMSTFSGCPSLSHITDQRALIGCIQLLVTVKQTLNLTPVGGHTADTEGPALGTGSGHAGACGSPRSGHCL
jgi:hypothetical protein